MSLSVRVCILLATIGLTSSVAEASWKSKFLEIITFGIKKDKSLPKNYPAAQKAQKLAPPPEAASINLTGKIIGAPEVLQDAGGGAKIKFDVQISNAGPETASGKIRLKPILVPEKTTRAWPEHGGRVLSVSDVSIDIPAAQSQTVTYEAALPTLAKGSYFVATIINSNGAVAESSLIDNVTDLAPLGELTVTSAPAPAALPEGAAVLDFISSNGANMETISGTIKHELNTYSLAASKAEPDFGAGRINRGAPNNSGELFARFMFADVKTRKVHTVIYQDDYGRAGFSAAQPEKFWFLVTWHNVEKMLDGRFRQHDTYSETTHFDGVPPGDYKYLVLINSHDFAETDVHNNLSVSDVSIRAARPKASATQSTASNGTVTTELALPELWLVSEPGKAPSVEGIGWTTDYSSAKLLGTAAKANAPWAKLVSENADLTGDTSVSLKGAFDAQDAEGSLSTGIDYEVSSIPSGELFGTDKVKGEVPVTHFVSTPATAPGAVLSTESLEIEDTYEALMAAKPQQITLKNPGKSELRWKALHLPTWLSIEPKEGTVAAGGSVVLDLTVDPDPINRGDSYSAEVQLMTNTASGAAGVKKVAVDLTLSLSE